MNFRRKNKQTVPMIYPKHGLAHWLVNVEEHLLKIGVTIKKNTEIVEVVKNSGEFYLTDNNGCKYEKMKLAYSKMFYLQRLIVNKNEIPISYEDDASQHIIFIVKGISPTRKLPFWRLMKDGYFMFFNDITRYSAGFREKYPGCRLINTRAYAYRTFSEDQIKTYFSHLSYVGYIPKEAELVDWEYKYYCPKMMTYAETYRFNKLLGKNAYELKSGTVGLHNGLRSRYGKYINELEDN